MITELRVRDLVTIADATLQLGPGLNVLTGETGAGKSMLVDALALLLGGRAESGAVRPGAGKAIVEAVFEPLPKGIEGALESLGLDPVDDRLVIRREVSTEGRSRAWVNGSPTTISALEQIGGWLVDLHGQHQSQSLRHPDAQRHLLDAYAGARADALAVAAAHRRLLELAREEADLVGRRDAALKRSDYLRHVVAEIDAAKLAADEEERLDRDITRLTHAEEMRELSDRIGAAVDGDDDGILKALHDAERALTRLERLDGTVTEWRHCLDGAYASLEELARLARDYARGVEDDPGRLRELESRRDVLDRLARKYGATVAAMQETRTQAAAELDLVDRAEFDIAALAAERRAAEEALRAAARGLSDRRRIAGDRLARAVNRQLPKLGLPGGRFEVGLIPVDPIGPHGADQVQFTAQLNLGLEARPVHRSASGGELSRLLLALTVALARQDGVPTLVFDEIDQGVGGEVGPQLGVALAEVAGRHQVLVITHLPTVAARADRHVVVSKRAKGGIATSDVEILHGEDRITEIARMLGDADGDSARRHAMTLLGPPVRR